MNSFMDYLLTHLQKSAFFISESLLFSSFWILFLPLLFFLSKVVERVHRIGWKLLFVALIVAVHLVTYPALVWILSKVFFYHTFSFYQTLNFGLSAYFFSSLFIYSVSLVLFTISGNKSLQPPVRTGNEIEQQKFMTTITIDDSGNKKAFIAVEEILYFSANPPYINVHLHSKKYLLKDTLKSLETHLDDQRFVRVHKSHIVNIFDVVSFQSRQNGDYDLTLSDKTTLRVSRNYSRDFKAKVDQHHRLTTN